MTNAQQDEDEELNNVEANVNVENEAENVIKDAELYVNTSDDRLAYQTSLNVINHGKVKDLYVYNQELTRFSKAKDRFGEYVKVESVNKHMLSTMLMNSVPVVRNKGGNLTDEIPKPAVMEHLLANKISEFEGVPHVDNITNTPTLMKNKKFLTTPGYDAETRTYYTPLNTKYKPETRTKSKLPKAEVTKARNFILNDVLGDFPWTTPSDKTNALSYLITQIIKSAYDFIIPLAFITSPQAGSGKTLIADLNLEIFGGVRKSFPNQEEELRKTIFSSLRGTQPTIIFDNINTGETLKSGYLAEILTSYRHTDRILGQSNEQEVVNGRIWMATGNNLAIGGDLATRIVPISIAPDMQNPEHRTGFKLNLTKLNDDIKQKIFYSLTVLIQDWVNAGCPEKQTPMRTFTDWASVLSGFMDHHKLPGFLENIQDVVSESDEEKNHGELILHLIYEQFKDEWFTTIELRQKALGSLQENETNHKIKFTNANDVLFHYLPQDQNGMLKNIQSIGKFLGKIKDTPFGEFKLVSFKNKKTKQQSYRVTKGEVK